MEDEMIDILDENMNKIGVVGRNEAHESGDWHRTFHCWVVSGANHGSVLFQKRGRFKKLFPNYLDITAAGHYITGEQSKDGIREILEELGIDVLFSELIPLGIKVDLAKIDKITNREFCDVFLLRKDMEPRDYSPDPEEVEGLVEISIPDGLALFAGETQEVNVKGIEWDKDTKKWIDINMDIKLDKFIPRIDPYYFKVFIMANKLLNGEKYLSI